MRSRPGSFKNITPTPPHRCRSKRSCATRCSGSRGRAVPDHQLYGPAGHQRQVLQQLVFIERYDDTAFRTRIESFSSETSLLSVLPRCRGGPQEADPGISVAFLSRPATAAARPQAHLHRSFSQPVQTGPLTYVALSSDDKLVAAALQTGPLTCVALS